MFFLIGQQVCSGELLSRTGGALLSSDFIGGNIELVNVLKGQVEEVMLVLPCHLAFCKPFTLCWARRRVGDLGDKIGRGGLGNSIHKHADEGSLQYDRKSKCKSKQDTFPVPEPAALLFRRKVNAAEVRLKLRIVLDCSQYGVKGER